MEIFNNNNKEQQDTQTSNTVMQGNIDKDKFPTSPVLLEYALAAYFYHYAAIKASQDILSESPNANGLFPSTISNYEIESVDYERDEEAEKAAETDIAMITGADEDIAESYRLAMEAVGQED